MPRLRPGENRQGIRLTLGISRNRAADAGCMPLLGDGLGRLPFRLARLQPRATGDSCIPKLFE